MAKRPLTDCLVYFQGIILILLCGKSRDSLQKNPLSHKLHVYYCQLKLIDIPWKSTTIQKLVVPFGWWFMINPCYKKWYFVKPTYQWWLHLQGIYKRTKSEQKPEHMPKFSSNTLCEKCFRKPPNTFFVYFHPFPRWINSLGPQFWMIKLPY